jgi:hypothetical protein
MKVTNALLLWQRVQTILESTISAKARHSRITN